MAEWRERGYVPDSDGEDDDDLDGSHRGGSAQGRTQGPGPSSGSAVPVTRGTQNRPSGEAQDGLEGTPSEFAVGREAALQRQQASSSSVLAAEDEEGPIERTELLPSGKHDSLIASSTSAWENGQILDDGDPMDVDDPPQSSPVANELQATLNIGLKQVGEVLRDAEHGNESVRDGSRSPSPLSSLGFLDHEFDKDKTAEMRPSTSSLGQVTEHVAEPSPQPLPELLVPQRAMRQRTQIQLHPYALEDARYQQELKARGLKPVRIAASQSQRPHNSLPSAGDEASLFSSSPVYEDSVPVSVPNGTEEEPSLNSGSVQNEDLDQLESPIGLDDDDEDLPDLASIFKDGPPRRRTAKSKQYRAVQPAAARVAERPEDVDVFDFPADEEPIHHISTEPATFFVPPSPPRSGSASVSDKIDDTQRDKYRHEATPRRLPTPLLSSEVRPRKRQDVELSDSSEDLSDGTGGSGSAASSGEENDKSGRIRAIKRRMKGVLPASWLKLDLKKQTVKENGRRPVDGRDDMKAMSASRPQTGLAVPSSVYRSDTVQFTFSDEDSSSDEGMELDRAEDPNTDEPFHDHGSMDVLEDNRIDTMQPTRKRRPFASSKPRRERQQRLSDAWQNNGERPDQQISADQSHDRSRRRPDKASTTKRQRKHKPAPRLSVLDAPGFVQLPIADQPRFLKVASRRAQQETRKTTQSSRGKFLRLATEEDTGDINRSLRQWQDGHIQPRQPRQSIAAAIGPAADRSSLPTEMTNTVDTNHFKIPALTTSRTTTALGALKHSTDATIQRILFKQQGLSPRPSREAAPVASTKHITASLARLRVGINSRKPIPNRAGLGSLQTAATHTRAAQVEHTLSDRPSAILSGSVTLGDNTSHQRIYEERIFQPCTSVAELDDELSTHSLQPAQSSKTPIKHTIRKSKAPQRTQTAVLREARRLTSSASLPTARDSNKTSQELNTVTDIMAELNRTEGERTTNDGWSILLPSLQKWLEVYADTPSIRTPGEKLQAKEIFSLCLELVSKCGWPTTWDDLIRKAAWFFASFDMVDPFERRIDPQLCIPAFLFQINLTMGVDKMFSAGTTYHIFLEMLAISLSQKSLEATNPSEVLATRKKKKTELQSYVNRLYPNNGRLLSEHEEVRKIHLASLYNRSSLYLTLYCYTTEGCRPRLSHFQNLVDMKKSHIKACDVVLEVWRVLASFHIITPETSQHDRLAEMGVWMQSMILAMVLKWVEARTEVEHELQIEAPGRIEDESLHLNRSAMTILHANQGNVEKFLRAALDNWTMALRKCECQSTAVQLINIPQLATVLENLTTFFEKNETMVELILGVIDQYLHKYSTIDHPSGSEANRVMLIISHGLDKVLTRRLNTGRNSQERAFERLINRNLTYDRYLLAAAFIVAKQRSWDDFLEPAGKYSWERFEDTKRAAQYKTLFIAFIITNNGEVYRDNKFWYLSYWLTALLRPSHQFVFENELCSAILEADQYEPILVNLPTLIKGGSSDSYMQIEDLKQKRTSLLGMVIENIATASSNYDSQAVDSYALQPSEMEHLLRMMLNTMRLTRSSLEHGSGERDEYELMVCKIADKMERHTSNIVPLEKWLVDADLIAFGLYHLRKRFGGPAPTTGSVLVPKQQIYWFQHICLRAVLHGSVLPISKVMRGVYTDVSEISEIEWYQPKMLAMMEQVFPAYLELALTDRGALIGGPLLEVLDSICQNAFPRALSIGSEDHSQLLDALHAIIVSARIALQRSNVDRDVATIMTFGNLTAEDISMLAPEPAQTRVLAFAAVVRIARIAVTQFRDVVRCAKLPEAELERICPHNRYINVFVKALYSVLLDGKAGHWSELPEAEWHHLKDPEADSVKQLAAEELEKHLRMDWNADPNGNWWVMQGRNAVMVERKEAMGVKDWLVRSYVKKQMLEYVDMFRATTRGEVLVLGEAEKVKA